MSVLVVGCGSIGLRHIRNLSSLGIGEILAFDPRSDRSAAAHELGARLCPSFESGLELRPDSVLVCTPPHLHVAAASAALRFGAHVFVEKPISAEVAGVDELICQAARSQRVLYVGYNLRFHAGLQTLKAKLDSHAIGRLLGIRAEFGQYLPDWRPDQDYRTGYNAHAASGGAIAVDISHEIDYVRWLAGEVATVYCAAAHMSSLEIDVEDTAAITMRMVNGMVAEVHLDYVQRGYTRTCKVIGESGTLMWDYTQGVRLMGNSGGAWQTFPIVPDPNQMYLEELRHFLDCARGQSQPLVDGGVARRVLEIALAAQESARTHQEIGV